MGGMVRAAAFLVAVVTLLSLTAGSASAAGWLPPVDVSEVDVSATTPLSSVQDVAVDGQGNAVAVWVRYESGSELVESATRPPGGVWSEAVEISEAGEEPLAVEVVINADGDAAAVWVGFGADNWLTVRAATRPAGGVWSDPVALSETERYATEPDVAIDDAGNVTALWSAGEGWWEHGVVEATTRPAGGEWSEPVQLSDGKALWPQVATDSEGDVTAVWTLLSPSRDDGIIQSKTRSAGGDWSSEAVDLSDEDGLARRPRIAIDAQGDATVVWYRYDIPAPSGFRYFVQAARRVDGTWSDAVSLTPEDGFADNPEVTIDPQGNATAIWTGGLVGTATRFVQARTSTPAGTWGETATLMTKSGTLEPGESDLGVVADSQGAVTAIWTAWAGSRLVVRSVRRGVGGEWSLPVDVSSSSGFSMSPQMAVDPQGYVTAVWSGRQGTAHAVRSRVLDPVAPELNEVTVPAAALVGEPVEMSVKPFDLWSPVTTAWDFGDGGSGSGTTVEHCFSSPGERTVTIAGTDLAANAATAVRTITIEPDPSPAPGIAPCGGPLPPEPPNPPDTPGGPGTAPGPGAAAPTISGLRQSNSRWRTPGGLRGSRIPVGTTFRFQLDRAARVRLAFLRVVRGLPDKIRGTVEVAGEAGPNAYRFRGRIRGRTLKPGRYRLLVTAAAEGGTSAPATIGFTIVR